MASEKITKIIDAVKELSVLELKELIDTSVSYTHLTLPTILLV